MNQIKVTGQGTEVVVSRAEDGHEYLRALLCVRSGAGPEGLIEVCCDDPLVVNRFRCYDVRRVLFVVGELRFRDEDAPFIAANVVEFAHQTNGRFRPFNPALPASKFAMK